MPGLLSSLTIATALATGVLSAPILPRTTCYSGLYMIVARGSYEEAGEGKPGAVASLIEAAVPDSGSIAVNYPATIISDDSIYPLSVTSGIDDTIDKIHSYVDACGDSSRIVLVGYSQGANVMTDALAGGILKPDPLEEEYRRYITAVTVFGDPSFTVDQSFDRGSSTKDGIFTRREHGDSLDLLNTYAGVLRSYCDHGDPFCADGDDLAVHTSEVANHEQEAADFVISLA